MHRSAAGCSVSTVPVVQYCRNGNAPATHAAPDSAVQKARPVLGRRATEDQAPGRGFRIHGAALENTLYPPPPSNIGSSSTK